MEKFFYAVDKLFLLYIGNYIQNSNMSNPTIQTTHAMSIICNSEPNGEHSQLITKTILCNCDNQPKEQQEC